MQQIYSPPSLHPPVKQKHRTIYNGEEICSRSTDLAKKKKDWLISKWMRHRTVFGQSPTLTGLGQGLAGRGQEGEGLRRGARPGRSPPARIPMEATLQATAPSSLPFRAPSYTSSTPNPALYLEVRVVWFASTTRWWDTPLSMP